MPVRKLVAHSAMQVHSLQALPYVLTTALAHLKNTKPHSSSCVLVPPQLTGKLGSRLRAGHVCKAN